MNAQTRPKAPTSIQSDLFRQADLWPEGFGYQPDLITPQEEAALVKELAEAPFEPFDFYGHLANRRVVGYGLKYNYGSRRIETAPAIPAWLQALREKVAIFAATPFERLIQVLINEYRPGAGVGWHRDRPHFDEVVGVSLLSPCLLRFRSKEGERWLRKNVSIAPRSAYLLSGPARTVWEHSVSPLDQLRYSITFRTLVDKP